MSMWIAREDPARPLNCSRALRALQSYLDGALDDTGARAVAGHLEGCHRCDLEAATYQAIKNSLGRRQRHSPRAVQRLRAFGEALLEDPDEPSRTQRSVSG